MSDDDCFVSNTVGFLSEDLSDDDRYILLSDAQKAAALIWVMDGLVRTNGIEGWIESLGQRSDDAVAALRALGATAHAEIFEQAVRLFPTRSASDADGRLTAVDGWSPTDVQVWREVEDRFLSAIAADDLIDNYVRPYVESRTEEFPQTVDDL